MTGSVKWNISTAMTNAPAAYDSIPSILIDPYCIAKGSFQTGKFQKENENNDGSDWKV